MTYTARWANPEHIGVLLLSNGNPPLYVDNGPIYDQAIAGVFGAIADPVVISTGPGADEIRRHRNQLLIESDWTQLPDAPVDQSAWTIYRQSLRDITEQEGFPENVEWPGKP